MKKKLIVSIIIPVYNEKNYIIKTLNRVNEKKKIIDLEIIVSDDCSDDGTLEILKENKHLYDKLVTSNKNLGKGSAISNSLSFINGDITIIQDADLEYNPEDYKKLIYPFVNLEADVVYGNRFGSSNYQRLHYFYNKIANKIITLITCFITNINFSDVEVGYKAFKSEILRKIKIEEKSFGFEIEITKKISKIKNIKIFEVPINYAGRSLEEGKKIRLKDAFTAIYCIFKY
jgi:glycosyltransferase involved in cell wall biosynthesis